MEQNVVWANGGSGLRVFPSCTLSGAGDYAQVYVFNNTSYGNEQDPSNQPGHSNSFMADLVLSAAAPLLVNGTYYSFTNNISQVTVPTFGNAATTPYTIGMAFYIITTTTNRTVASGNFVWNGNPVSGGANSTAGLFNTDVYVNGVRNTATWPFGTNTYGDPGFANPAALPSGAPNCSGYTNTTDCMLAGYGVYAALTPSGGAASAGYHPPAACTADPYFPFWLKGIVYLSYNSGTGAITETAGLITKPCNY